MPGSMAGASAELAGGLSHRRQNLLPASERYRHRVPQEADVSSANPTRMPTVGSQSKRVHNASERQKIRVHDIGPVRLMPLKDICDIIAAVVRTR